MKNLPCGAPPLPLFCWCWSLLLVVILSSIDAVAPFQGGGPPAEDWMCSTSDGNCNPICNWPQTGFDDGDCISISISSLSPEGGLNNESETMSVLEEAYPDCLPALIDKYGSVAPGGNIWDDWSSTTNQVGNQQCNSGGPFDMEACGYEFGECVAFHNDYPNCDIPGAALSMGDGQCNEEYNTKECHRDGGDCRFSVRQQILIIIGISALVVCSGMWCILRMTKRSRTSGGSASTSADAAAPSQNDPDVQMKIKRDFRMVVEEEI